MRTLIYNTGRIKDMVFQVGVVEVNVVPYVNHDTHYIWHVKYDENFISADEIKRDIYEAVYK